MNPKIDNYVECMQQLLIKPQLREDFKQILFAQGITFKNQQNKEFDSLVKSPFDTHSLRAFTSQICSLC